MNFEQVYAQADRSATEAAYSREECEKLFNLCIKLGPKANAVEIGVQYGRSTTVIGMCAKERGFHFTAIDNWSENDDTKEHVELLLISEMKLPINLISQGSVQASKKYRRKIDLIHIDGDHSYEGVNADINAWLPKVKKGGFVIFDDYGPDSLPGVYKAVGEHSDKLQFLGRFGGKLGLFKKL